MTKPDLRRPSGLEWCLYVLALALLIFGLVRMTRPAHGQDVPPSDPLRPRIGSLVHYVTQWEPPGTAEWVAPEDIGDHFPGIVVEKFVDGDPYRVDLVTAAGIHKQTDTWVGRTGKPYNGKAGLGTWHWPWECTE